MQNQNRAVQNKEGLTPIQLKEFWRGNRSVRDMSPTAGLVELIHKNSDLLAAYKELFN